MSRNKDSITLGSGKLYLKETKNDIPKTPAEILELINQIKDEANRVGYISGGASLEYAAEWYTAKDDLGYVMKTILTSETATLKSGLMTFNAESLQTLSSTTRIEESGGNKILKIGGVGNQDGKKYIILFYHEDKDEGDLAIFIVGKNQAGFTLAFAKDKETVIDAEFSALPMDDEGTLVAYVEYAENAPVTPAQKYNFTIAADAGGSITTGANGQYEAGAEIGIAATADSTYTFEGWASSAGGTFADASAENTTFTMPANDTAVMASFEQ